MHLREAINKASDIDDLDEAVGMVQDAMGICTGDEACIIFSDIEPYDWKMLDPDRRSVRLIQYARYEMAHLMEYNRIEKALKESGRWNELVVA